MKNHVIAFGGIYCTAEIFAPDTMRNGDVHNFTVALAKSKIWNAVAWVLSAKLKF